MEFADYWVISASELSKAKKHYEAPRIWSHDDHDWALVLSNDSKLASRFSIAMHFHDDEGAAWGFTLHVKGKEIAGGLFGENMETGVSEEDNFLNGDMAKIAETLDVDQKKLAKIFAAEFPDSGAFAKLVGFPFVPVSASEADYAIKQMKKTKKKPTKPAKKPTKKPKKKKR